MLADRDWSERIFCGSFRYSGLERVSDHHPTVHRPVLQILAQKQRAVLRLRGADNEAVPPRQTIAPLDFPGSRQHIDIDCLRIPLEKAVHDVPGVVRRQDGLILRVRFQ